MVSDDELQQGGDWFAATTTLLTLMVADLNESLRSAGLSKSQRKVACEDFLFAFCERLDQGWIRTDGRTHYPLLAFSKRFLDINTKLSDVLPILLPDKGDELHAVASEIVNAFFDDQKEQLPKHLGGDIGDELPDEPVVRDDPPAIPMPCPTCKGTGDCYCVRTSSSVQPDCVRCSGTGKCRHCSGTGVRR
jgi:hypothetical protein